MPSFWQKLFPGKILKTYEIEIQAHERFLGQIRDFVTQICNETGFAQPETNNIKLALDEACSNVVRHAYKGMEEGTLKLRVLRRARGIELFVTDKGKSFEWKKARTPDLNRYVEIGKKGGLGIWFIRKLMDETEYRSTRKGNELHLVKFLKGPRPETLPVPVIEPAPVESPIGTGIVLQKRRMSVRIKYLFPVTAAVALLVLGIFSYMFTTQAKTLRTQILSGAQETAGRLAKESVLYLLKRDDLHLANLVKTAVRSDPKIAYAFVVDTQNFIWAHSLTDRIFQTYQPPAQIKEPTGKVPLTQEIQNDQQQMVHDIAFPVFLESQKLGTAHLGVTEQSILENIRAGRQNAFLIFLIALALSTSAAYFFMSFLVEPVRKLTEGMLAISQGKLDHRIMIRSNDEFGQIAHVFNEMTRRFAAAQKNLIEQERIQQEMEVAQEIQHTLLPREVPQMDGYDVASLYRSAKEVGGDYFDFVWVDDNILGIAVADVSGKGIPGSLVMTMIRTALRLEARGNRNATDVMAKVNAFVTRDMKKGMFVTMFYIILDARNRVINYSSAGHNPMILFREENQQIYFLKPRGFPLGIDLPDPALFAKSLTQEHVSLKQGDLLLVYTDGITEAMNPRREQFGEKRLIDLVQRHHLLSSSEFVDRLSQEIAAFTEDYPQNDDITFVAVKEKMRADDVQVNLQRKLFSLVESGTSVKEACHQLNVSPHLYYRWKKLRDQFGSEGLEKATEVKTAGIKMISLDERQLLVDLVRDHPEYGAKRLTEALAALPVGAIQVSETMVYQELKRLRMGTRVQRETYATRRKLTS